MDEVDDVQLHCLEELETFICEIRDAISESTTFDHEFVDSITIKCERLLNVVLLLAEVDDVSSEMINGLDEVYDNIEEVIASLISFEDDGSAFVAAMPSQGIRGRQKLQVAREQLEFLVDANFTQKEIASLLRCSTKTISRRMKEFNLELAMKSMQITDDDLDNVTVEYVKRYPNAGQKSYAAFLSQQGLHVPRQMIRKSLLRVDPEGVMGRFRKAFKRRCYKVPGSNSIWHLDSYHKLIRWGIIIHGGIDGFSRLPVYLMAASNNKAMTVLNCFLEAITIYGLPSRIRCYKGGENSLISQYMLAHPARGPGRRSCITGKSVHN